MKKTLLLSFLFVFFSCIKKHEGENKSGLVSNFVNISDNEDKGIKEILAFYGGRCEYGYAFSGEDKAFWIKLSEAKALDQPELPHELIASNIAFMFYKNLKDEKSNYSEIQVELVPATNKLFKSSFTLIRLETVQLKMVLFDSISSLIKLNKDDEIKKFLEPNKIVEDYDPDKLISNMKESDREFGTVTSVNHHGFKFVNEKDGKEYLRIYGTLVRDKQSNQICIELDPGIPSDKILYLNYAWF